MRTNDVRPTGQERTFETDEIIVTKTDTRGVITYANDVFLRVSALSEEDAMGRPHNLIRHPAMPRCVFRQLWSTLQAGEEMFAYIVNLALDGQHYWVFAHVTPSFDPAGRIVGYHSNRRVPDRSAVVATEQVYRRLLTEEARHAKPTDAVEAGHVLLQEILTERGLTFDEWVWSLTPEEVAA
jgi:PAS domain S-box-containing protein